MNYTCVYLSSNNVLHNFLLFSWDWISLEPRLALNLQVAKNDLEVFIICLHPQGLAWATILNSTFWILLFLISHSSVIHSTHTNTHTSQSHITHTPIHITHNTHITITDTYIRITLTHTSHSHEGKWFTIVGLHKSICKPTPHTFTHRRALNAQLWKE